jgi:hypothetical protein
MPASLKRIRTTINVTPTAGDKCLTVTIKVTAYDNGMVEGDGIPINEARHMTREVAGSVRLT